MVWEEGITSQISAFFCHNKISELKRRQSSSKRLSGKKNKIISGKTNKK
jgi:hypothetical protein